MQTKKKTNQNTENISNHKAAVTWNIKNELMKSMSNKTICGNESIYNKSHNKYVHTTYQIGESGRAMKNELNSESNNNNKKSDTDRDKICTNDKNVELRNIECDTARNTHSQQYSTRQMIEYKTIAKWNKP